MDGPVADYRDEEGLHKSCLLSRSLGFEGRWCIHSAQIEIVNEVFSPTKKELEWAEKVVAAYEEANAAGSGAVSVEGQMVDAASIRMARNILRSCAGVRASDMNRVDMDGNGLYRLPVDPPSSRDALRRTATRAS